MNQCPGFHRAASCGWFGPRSVIAVVVDVGNHIHCVVRLLGFSFIGRCFLFTIQSCGNSFFIASQFRPFMTTPNFWDLYFEAIKNQK
jgi:hypothetical protein